MNRFSFILFALVLMSCKHYENPHIVISTNFGDIEAALFPEKAPKTVAAFLSYVDSGFYNNSSFYRVLLVEGLNTDGNTGLIQGGIYQTNEKEHPVVPGILHESTRQTGLSHTTGTISLARTTAGTASTEFFICIGDQTQFDYGNGSPADGLGFAAFGTVVEGMAVVRKIQGQPKNDQSLNPKIIINNIKRL